MRDGRPKNSARVLIETSNLPDPLVVVDVGVMTTVVTMKTVLLASCVVVGDRELKTSGVVDVSVDVVVDVVVGEIVDVVIELVVVDEEETKEVIGKETEEEVVEVVVEESEVEVRYGRRNVDGKKRL